MKAKKPTRELIIETAVSLFNSKGAHSVTTNHIAEEMQISPGNLYYHFHNKQEIIREIFSAITAEFTAIWTQNFSEDKNRFFEIYMQTADLYYRYRFFYLELPTLTAQDPELKKMYIANMDAKQEIIRQAVAEFTKEELIVPPSSPRELQSWMENSWIISDFYLSLLAVTGKTITRESIQEGILNFFYILKPSLTQKGLSLVQSFL